MPIPSDKIKIVIPDKIDWDQVHKEHQEMLSDPNRHKLFKQEWLEADVTYHLTGAIAKKQADLMDKEILAAMTGETLTVNSTTTVSEPMEPLTQAKIDEIATKLKAMEPRLADGFKTPKFPGTEKSSSEHLYKSLADMQIKGLGPNFVVIDEASDLAWINRDVEVVKEGEELWRPKNCEPMF